MCPKGNSKTLTRAPSFFSERAPTIPGKMRWIGSWCLAICPLIRTKKSEFWHLEAGLSKKKKTTGNGTLPVISSPSATPFFAPIGVEIPPTTV